MACIQCGAEEPTHIFEFTEEMGAIYVRILRTKERELCRRCVGIYFRKAFLMNLFLGWWGFISFFKTPINLVQNIAEFWRCRDLEMPDAAAMANALATGPAFAHAGGGSFWGNIAFVVMIPVLMLALAFSQWQRIEAAFPPEEVKAPASTADNTAEGLTDGDQIMRDIGELQTELPVDNWTAFRIALLARQPYIKRLSSENDQLQRVAGKLRAAPEAEKDACGRWEENELAQLSMLTPPKCLPYSRS